MKICSISLIIREVKIKPTVKYHLIPIRMAHHINKNNMMMRIWKNWNFCALLERMYNGIAAVGNSKEVPQNLKIELPDDPAIPLIYPKELKGLRQIFVHLCLWKHYSQ